MQDFQDIQIPEVLQWRPKWWWDPIPPWVREDLIVKIGPELTKIQLNKVEKMLEAELRAVRETQKLLGG